MNSFRLTEGGLAGFSRAGPRNSGSGRTILGGGGGTTNSSGIASDPSSLMPSDTEKNYMTLLLIHNCIHVHQILYNQVTLKF